MTDLRTAAQRALEAMDREIDTRRCKASTLRAMIALRAALAQEATSKKSLQVGQEEPEAALVQQERCRYPDCKCPTENPCLKGLAQEEQEPVADLRRAFWLDPECADAGACQSLKFKAHPPRRETEQEPVAYLYHDASTPQDAHPWLHSTMLVLAADRRPSLRGETPLFTHPPRREWVSLTEEEKADILFPLTAAGASDMDCARAIEQALRSKNNG